MLGAHFTGWSYEVYRAEDETVVLELNIYEKKGTLGQKGMARICLVLGLGFLWRDLEDFWNGEG